MCRSGNCCCGSRPSGQLTGYGYGAFWLETSPTAHYIWDVIGWPTPEAHNSYIDLLLQVGVPGVLFSSAVLFGTIRYALVGVADRVPWAVYRGQLCHHPVDNEPG